MPQTLSRRVVKHSVMLDEARRYLTNSPDPAKMAAIMQAVDNGDVAAMVELNDEMEGKDAHLQGVANTRRLGLTALPWSIAAPSDLPEERQSIAEEAQAFVLDTLAGIPSWDASVDQRPSILAHLSTAIGPGIAVVELVWYRGRLIHMEPVPGHRLTGDLFGGHGVFVQTDNDIVQGVRARQRKFVVFTPSARAGLTLGVTITRAQADLWLMKHYSIADWSAFAEVYGMPLRIATILDGAPSGASEDAASMLKNMGSDTYAVFPDGVKIDLLEAARANQPFEAMVDWAERKQSILYLGQTTTTEPGQVGSLALGRVHDTVRASLTLSDIKNEAQAIQQQILRWIVRHRAGTDLCPHGEHREQARRGAADAQQVGSLRRTRLACG
jgi:phage gp29-like protein